MIIDCAIIENETLYTEQLSTLLYQWSKEKNCSIKIDTFQSGIEFFKHKNESYPIIFIDIILDDELNGIEIAQQLRQENYKESLVFLTNFQEYVFEGYPVQALDYLLKPASYEKISRCMNKILKQLGDKSFIYRIKDKIIKIPYYDILYFSSNNHYIELHTQKNCYRISQTLRNILKILPEDFAQCHRTLIVNMQHVQNITNKQLLLSNQEYLPISQTYLKEVQLVFLQQINYF